MNLFAITLLPIYSLKIQRKIKGFFVKKSFEMMQLPFILPDHGSGSAATSNPRFTTEIVTVKCELLLAKENKYAQVESKSFKLLAQWGETTLFCEKSKINRI